MTTFSLYVFLGPLNSLSLFNLFTFNWRINAFSPFSKKKKKSTYFWLWCILVAAHGTWHLCCCIEALHCSPWAFSQVEARGAFTTCSTTFSRCTARALEYVGLVIASWSSLVGARVSSCSVACGILVPWPGLEPQTPALQGGFSTTGSPGKSLYSYAWGK